MKTTDALLLYVALMVCAQGSAKADPPGSGWTLTYDQEFTSLPAISHTAGSQTPGWLPCDYYNDHWYPNNGEQQFYCFPGINTGYNPFSIGAYGSVGTLNITANKTPTGMAAQGQPYVSGMLTTAQGASSSSNVQSSTPFSQKYGYFETRCILPTAQGVGFWPAFWMMPASGSGAAEYDIFEVLGNAPTTIFQTSHWSNYTGQDSFGYSGINTATGMHTYGFEWDATNIRWYVDGVLTETQPNQCNEAMYLLFNLAVGGAWPGNPNAGTTFPGVMQIEYLRVYAGGGVTPSSITAQYGFEGNTQDASGHGLNGTGHGVTFTTGIVGAQAGAFNGISSYVDLNNASPTGPLKPALPVTVSAWVKLTNTTGVQRIFSSDNTDNASVIAGYDLSVNSGVLACDYGDAAGVYAAHRRTKTGTTVLASGTWYHVAAVIQGPANMQLYVNGIDDGGSYGGTGGAMAYTAATSKIGTSNTTQFFNGTIDGVQIYNSALGATQVGLLWYGTIAYWGLNEGWSGATADATGNGIGGVLVNSPAWTASGKIGDALAFNGTSSYVDLRNTSATSLLKPALPVTVSAWVKLNNITGVQRVFSSDNTDNATVIAGYDLSVNSGVLACDYGDAAGVYAAHRRTKTGTTVLTAGTWYHVAAVIQGPTNMQLYVNGVDNGGTYGGTGGAMAYTTTSSKIGTSNTAQFFNGTLDEVGVYNRALGAAEINDLMTGP